MNSNAKEISEIRYEITVDNSNHINKGIKEVFLDKENIGNNKLPDLNDGNKHDVKIRMR